LKDKVGSLKQGQKLKARGKFFMHAGNVIVQDGEVIEIGPAPAQ
jgi:hypothetical protein